MDRHEVADLPWTIRLQIQPVPRFSQLTSHLEIYC